MTILNHHLSNIFGLWEETRPLGRKTNQRNHEGATHMQSPNRRTPKHNSYYSWDKPNFCHKYKSVALKWPWLCLKKNEENNFYSFTLSCLCVFVCVQQMAVKHKTWLIFPFLLHRNSLYPDSIKIIIKIILMIRQSPLCSQRLEIKLFLRVNCCWWKHVKNRSCILLYVQSTVLICPW